MSSFEWMELQTLISDLELARSRLTDARRRKDQGRIRALEDEIEKGERLRVQLLAHISTNIVSGDPAPPPREKAGAVEAARPEPAETASAVEPEENATGGADSEPALVLDRALPIEAPMPAAEADIVAPDQVLAHAAAPPLDEINGRETIPDAADRIVARGPAPPASGPNAGSAEGGVIVWEQLTPDHIERAKRELAIRRAEMLARHAEELKALEAEQSQLDGLEQAIQAFLQKFSRPADDAAVVALDQERGLRQPGA